MCDFFPAEPFDVVSFLFLCCPVHCLLLFVVLYVPVALYEPVVWYESVVPFEPVVPCGSVVPYGSVVPCESVVSCVTVAWYEPVVSCGPVFYGAVVTNLWGVLCVLVVFVFWVGEEVFGVCVCVDALGGVCVSFAMPFVPFGLTASEGEERMLKGMGPLRSQSVRGERLGLF